MYWKDKNEGIWIGVKNRDEVLGVVLFTLLKQNLHPKKQLLHPMYTKNPLSLPSKLQTEQCGGTETCHLHSRYFFIRNLSLVLSRIDI